MNKVLAAMIAGLFAVGAHAQSTSQEAVPPTNTKPQQRAEMKKDAKPAGKVSTGSPEPKVAENSGTGTTPTAADKVAQKRRDDRDVRRAAKDGSKKPVPKQGGTPQ